MDKISHARLVGKRPQPLQQFRCIGMIAELLKRSDLRPDGDEVAEDLHFWRATLDDCATRTGRLEADKKDEILRIGEALGKMMEDSPARCHAARRNNDGRILASVDFL